MRGGISITIAALLLAACGDPIASGDYEGESRMHLEGIVCGHDDVTVEAERPTVGVLWKWYDAEGERVAFGQVSSIPTTSFPAHFAMDIFDLPPADAPNAFASPGGDLQADVGCPVVFDDHDADGEYGMGDEILAVSWNHLLVYVHDDPSALSSMLPLRFDAAEPVSPGYRVVQGVCEDGQPSGRLTFAPDGAVVPITVLETPDKMPEEPPAEACIRFF